MGILEDAREAAAQPTGPRRGASTQVWAVARLISIDPVTGRASISLHGSQPIDLPYNLAAVYTGATTVDVLCDPMTAAAVYVLGPRGTQVDVPDIPQAPPAVQAARATIAPVWSGTWRSVRAAWDRWNVANSTYGGRSTLYQGSLGTSGPLTGLAVYADQLVNLGALAITGVTVSVPRIPDGLSVGAQVVLQGSPAGAQPVGAPTVLGESAASTSDQVVLSSAMCEDLRTGVVKGLALLGPAYAGVFGSSHPAGMVMTVDYTRAT